MLRKDLKTVQDNITFQFYLVSDTLKINFSNIRKESELVLLNNFLNLVIKEFLVGKNYKVSKKEILLQKEEKKLDDVLTKQIEIKPLTVFEEKPKKGVLF